MGWTRLDDMSLGAAYLLLTHILLFMQLDTYAMVVGNAWLQLTHTHTVLTSKLGVDRHFVCSNSLVIIPHWLITDLYLPSIVWYFNFKCQWTSTLNVNEIQQNVSAIICKGQFSVSKIYSFYCIINHCSIQYIVSPFSWVALF